MGFDDPELFKFPVAYLSEPRGLRFNDAEIANFRAYLQKGGFLIIDDFRYREWDYFESQLLKLLPDARVFDIPPSDPIFHSFFEVNDPEHVPQFYDPGLPIFRGVYENNDPTKRLMMAICYNTDISEFWEFSSTGFKPVDESNEAFKVGVNFFLYGLTH
jgi:hypothetical protein